MVDNFRVAEVAALFQDGTAKVKFIGEDMASEKEYAYLASYKPTVNDKVFLIPFADSYIIAGKVLYMQGPGQDVKYITADELSKALTGYAQKVHSHDEYAKSDHTHSGYAPTNHSHTEYAGSSHKHYQLVSELGNVSVGIQYANAGPFIPNTSMDLGSTNKKWKVVYATTGTIQTSDKNQKKNIEEIDERYEKMFIRLEPVSYQFVVNESNRIHVGFVAQSVKNAMDEAGISSREFGGYIEAPVWKEDESGKELDEVDHIEYGLRYGEFIALNTMMIQRLMKRIEELEKSMTERSEKDA